MPNICNNFKRKQVLILEKKGGEYYDSPQILELRINDSSNSDLKKFTSVVEKTIHNILYSYNHCINCRELRLKDTRDPNRDPFFTIKLLNKISEQSEYPLGFFTQLVGFYKKDYSSSNHIRLIIDIGYPTNKSLERNASMTMYHTVLDSKSIGELNPLFHKNVMKEFKFPRYYIACKEIIPCSIRSAAPFYHKGIY